MGGAARALGDRHARTVTGHAGPPENEVQIQLHFLTRTPLPALGRPARGAVSGSVLTLP